MNKKFWLAFIVIFIAMSICSFIIHGIILSPTYQSADMKYLWRPDMEAKMWIYYVVYLFISFFFVLIFSKGYTGKGVTEGARYGIYIGFLMSIPMAFSTYTMFPIQYPVAIQWFIYSFIQYIILGIIVSLVYGKQSPATS